MDISSVPGIVVLSALATVLVLFPVTVVGLLYMVISAGAVSALVLWRRES